MDLDSFLVSLYVLIDDWWRERRPPAARKKKSGRPALLADSEVLTLADPVAAYRIVGTTLIPAVVRVRACRKSLFAGQASFGRCRSKTLSGSTGSRSRWWSIRKAW